MHNLQKSPRGFTLVELMIVVAILGVLAAMSSIGYTRYIKNAQMAELEQIALEVAAGQQRFRARQNAFFPLGGGTKIWTSTTDKAQIIALLEVRSELPAGVRLRVHSWEGMAGGGAAMCGFCNGLGDTSTSGFLVGVQRDYDGIVETEDPMVIVTNDLRPVTLFEDNR